jgi:hypothetical protein
MAARIQIRRDISTNWTTNNPILTEGELGYETNTSKLKIGDGSSSWNSLEYFPKISYGEVLNAPTNEQISEWDTAYSWGDHNIAGYLLESTASLTYQPLDSDLTSIAGLSGTNGLLRKTAADTWQLDTTNYLTVSSAASSYQPLDGDLTSIAGLSGTTGLLRKTAADTWTLDTNNYLTTADAAGGVGSQDILNWNEAYSWGNHADAGYLEATVAATTYQPRDPDLIAIASLTSNGFLKRVGVNDWVLDNSVYLTTESDPVFTASAASSITSTLINNWNTAYSWGNHAVSGYLTSYTETDPIFVASPAAGITGTQITNWNSAFSWGDHGAEGYARVEGTVPSTPTSTGTAGSIAYDATYFYTCIATNTWKRVEWDATWV